VRRAVVLLLGLALAAGPAAAAPAETRLPGQVTRYAGTEALAARLAWALDEASKAGPARAFSVGWSFRRLMAGNEMIGSYRDGPGGREITVEEVLAGKRSLGQGRGGEAGEVRVTARKVLDDLEHRGQASPKVPRDVGIFLAYEPGRPASLAEVELSNLDLSFDFKGRDLYWLGGAEAAESFGLVKALYGAAAADKAKHGLIAAAGLHGAARLAVPFLETVLGGGEPGGLRKEAAFWLGQQGDADGLKVLVRAAESDRSKDVREGAVFAASQVELPEAVDAIIALARNAPHPDARKQAVFWLGQMASKKAAPALEDFARSGGDADLQEQAVFALSQLPDDQGLEPLIKLAKSHPDPRVRKKAVFWLGESRDPRALEALIAIVKGR